MGGPIANFPVPYSQKYQQVPYYPLPPPVYLARESTHIHQA